MEKNIATSIQQKNILVVDDEEQVLFVIGESLKKLGSQTGIVTAPSGESALALIQNNSFDLIVTDLKMPGMGGVALTKAVRTVSPDIPIVWMTAYGNAEIEEEAKRLNVQNFLTKPLDIADIRQIARDALETSIQHQEEETLPFNNSDERLRDCLSKLKSETGAYTVLLTTSAGNPIETIGIAQDLDVISLSALVAGNFLAANEIAQMLKRDSNFKLSYYESDQHNIYAYGVGKKYLLIIVFGNETRTGVVWFYTQRLVPELEEILEKMEKNESMERKLNPIFLQEAENKLDDMWEKWMEDPAEPADAKQEQPSVEEQFAELFASTPDLLSFGDARARGIIKDDAMLEAEQRRKNQ